MAEKLSDNDIDDRLKRAREVLGEEPDSTKEGNAPLDAARKALTMLSFALIAAGLEREDQNATGPTWPWPVD